MTMNQLNGHHNRDASYLSLMKDINVRPVFILGFHRSGTTLLYELLARTGCFNVLQAYHLIRYDELLSNHLNHRETEARQELAREFDQLGLTDRIIDNVAVTPELPEEYGFRLMQTTPQARLMPGNVPSFIELCRKVQYISAPERTLLLKNPWDFDNFLFVKSVIPDARFVFIHRHPMDVLNSLLKAVRSLMGERNPYMNLINPRYGLFVREPFQSLLRWLLFTSQPRFALWFLVRYVALAADYYVQKVAALTEDEHISIRYEDLCAGPGASIRSILSFLELTPPSFVNDDTLIAPRPRQWLPEVASQAEKVHRKLRSYYERHGYEPLSH
jgi:hypothetical protein